MKSSLEEFVNIYMRRPIIDNSGGMGINHSWALWYLLRKMHPKLVVESGVWRGHSTWIIEQACPEANVISFDVDLSRRLYRSRNALYVERDFNQFDWSEVDVSDSIIFFDDHQNCYERMQNASWFGFSKMIFEDNWPVGEGDCYSIRHLLAGAGATSLQMSANYLGTFSQRRKRQKAEAVLRERIHGQRLLVEPNVYDASNFWKRVSLVQEMPPVALHDRTQWGTEYMGGYESAVPLSLPSEYPGIDLSYSYLTYVELKNSKSN